MSHGFNRILALALVLLVVGCKDKPQNDQTELQVEVAPAESVSSIGPPVTRVEAVSDRYHGIDVEDPYRWLENWDNQEVKDWSEGQNAYARSLLAALPERPAVHARITEILKSL